MLLLGHSFPSLGIEEVTEMCVACEVFKCPSRAKATRTEAAIWLLQLRDGLEIKGKSELPVDKRPEAIHIVHTIQMPTFSFWYRNVQLASQYVMS